jgi:hypothetical protein
MKSNVNISFQILIATATAIGAFGGFPDPPYLLQYIIKKYPLIKWVLLSVLIYQGGGGMSNNESLDILISVLITASVYMFSTLMNKMFTKQMLEEKTKKI